MKRERLTRFRYRVLLLGVAAFIFACVYLFYMSHLLLDRATIYMTQDLHHFHRSQCIIHPDPSSENCSNLRYQITSDITTFEILWKGNYKLGDDGVSYLLPTSEHIHSQSKPDSLTVFIVPHSHNDPGWIKTAEEYFVDNTKHILNNMVEKLNKYPNMTFIWAETVFLSMWWSNIEDDVKANVRRLVQRGQLEIVSGGWVMPDEACTHYASLISQLIEGHQWLQQHLRVKPTNSWSVDAFGHSATLAYIMKQSGFENMVIQRIHQASKAYLAERKKLEFKWRQFWDDTGSEDILCHVMPYLLYSIKHSCGPDRYFCLQFDFRNIPGEARESRSEPITESNVKQQATYMYEQFRKKASLYNYNTLLVPLGDDFYFTRDVEWDQQYTNYQKLFSYINTQKEWNTKVRFGTLSDFFASLRKHEHRLAKIRGASMKFPTLSGDFFVYSDKKHDYWSGYFSTRPFAKRLSREVQASIQAAETLIALKHKFQSMRFPADSLMSSIMLRLQQARRSLASFLHHDAITGTSRDVVAQNFLEKLLSAFSSSQEVLLATMASLLRPSYRFTNQTLELIPLVDYSTNPASIQQNIISVYNTHKYLVFFNPLTTKRREVVHITVDTNDFIITDENRKPVLCQVNAVISGDRNNLVLFQSKFEVSFLLVIGPLQILRYKIEYMKYSTPYISFSKLQIKNADRVKIPSNYKIITTKLNGDDMITLKNEKLHADFSGNDGQLLGITNLESRNQTKIAINFIRYKSVGGGAYILRIKPYPHPFTEFKPLITVSKGVLFHEIVVYHEVGAASVKHRVRLYSCGQQAYGLHIENTVDIKPLMDAEIAMTVNADFGRTTNFYSDENGFQYIAREHLDKLTPSGNFYPMTTMAFMEDKYFRVTLHSGQPLAVGIVKPRQFEVILDRITRNDDGRGLGQGVTDNRPTTSYFILQLENKPLHMTNIKKEYAFPSLLNSAINDVLQQPIIMSYASHLQQNHDVNTPDLSFYRKNPANTQDVTESDMAVAFTPLLQPFPCDINIVGMYNMIDSMMDIKQVALILHRKVLECSLPSLGVDCSFTKGILDLPTYFNNFPFKLITKTSLSLLHDISRINAKDLKLSRMEIAAFKL